jgi:hypothetical protein
MVLDDIDMVARPNPSHQQELILQSKKLRNTT